MSGADDSRGDDAPTRDDEERTLIDALPVREAESMGDDGEDTATPEAADDVEGVTDDGVSASEQATPLDGVDEETIVPTGEEEEALRAALDSDDAESSSEAEEPETPTLDEPDSLDIPDPDALADSPDELGEEMPDASKSGFTPSTPVVTAARPARVDRRGGTPVALLGAGFGAGCSVFVGTEELIAEVIDAFTLHFVAPSGSGTVRVEAETASGTRSSGVVEIEFVEGPTIVRAIPPEGPLEGGIEVVVEGDGFVDGCMLSLFGMHAPDVVFESPKRIRFVLPPAGDGGLEGALVVTNADGLVDKNETVFRYRPLDPRLDAIEPAHGWMSGGKVVGLRGSDFHRRARVFLGELEAIVHYRSHERVEIEVPEAEAIGLVDVVLVNPDKKVASLTQAFTYEPVPAPPKIIDVFPRQVTTLGKVMVRINGDNFTDDVRVMVGEVTTVRKVLSAKLIDVEIPPRTLPGAVAVAISLEGVTVRAEDAVEYVSPSAPVITHLEPRNGPTGGGTKVTIEGTGFPPNATVLFDGRVAKSVSVKSAEKIETVTPPGTRAALVDVEVASPETGGGISKAGFKYEQVAPPTITSVAPNRGTIDGGTELGVEGKNFSEGAVIVIGGIPMKTRRISGSLLEAKTPEGDDGKLVDVAVKNADGQQAVQKRAFQYDARYRA